MISCHQLYILQLEIYYPTKLDNPVYDSKQKGLDVAIRLYYIWVQTQN